VGGIVAAAMALAGCNVYAPVWSTTHADSSNSDYARVAGADDLTLAWHHDFGGRINVGATFDQAGRVYVTSAEPGCHLAVLDRDTGETVRCVPELNLYASVSSALVDQDGRIFIADSDAMHAFDRDGNLLWETPIVGVPLSAQFTPNGRVIFITHIGRIYVLRRVNGQPVLPPVELIPGATFDPSEGIQACARGTEECPSANVIAVDLETGRFIFTFWEPGAPNAGVRAMRITEDPVPAIEHLWTNDSLPGGSASSPTVSADGSRVYVNDNVDSIHALDTATGEEIWSFPIGYASGGSPSLSPEGLIMPAGGGASPLLAVRDIGAAGELAWRADALLNRGIPTQADGHRSYATVGLPQFHNDLVVVDTETGAELDRESIPGVSIFTVGTTVDSGGMVYVPTILGDLYAFRPA
jgi:outer membrane protein assembly factor BamB